MLLIPKSYLLCELRPEIVVEKLKPVVPSKHEIFIIITGTRGWRW